MDAVMIGWTTVDAPEAAEHLAIRILDARLAACIQISDPITSIYRFNGNDVKSSEWRLTIKFPQSKLKELEPFIMEHHPYDTPQWVVVKADHALTRYANWVVDSCS